MVYYKKRLHGTTVSPVSRSAQFPRANPLRESRTTLLRLHSRLLTAKIRYRFRADLYGTSWYHSHYSAQYAGGLFGPMVIYGPKHIPYDIDLGPVLLSDCTFSYSF